VTTTTRPAYDERLVAPWWAWLAALAVSLLVAAQIHGGAEDPVRSVAPYVVVPLLALGVVAGLSRGRVQVRDGVLHVPGARVSLDEVCDVTPLDKQATQRLRGPRADPFAYTATRPWLSRSVRVGLDDPADDTPYWVVGTRRPDALAAALRPGRRVPRL
jgi:hypothetical protein